MRRHLAIPLVVLAGLAAGRPAEADTISFLLHGTVTAVQTCPAEWGDSCSSHWASHGITVGTPWEGLLTLGLEEEAWASGSPWESVEASLQVEVGDYRGSDALVSVMWIMGTWRDADHLGFYGLLPYPEDSDLFMNWRWPANVDPDGSMAEAIRHLDGSSLISGSYEGGYVVGPPLNAEIDHMHLVPEPGSLLLLSMGLAGLLAAARRRL